MRKADRIIRDRHSRIPDKYKKIDTTVNGNAESLAEQHKEVERRLFLYALTRLPLSMSQQTSKTKHMLRKHVNGWG